jgi:hypothetical protein
MKITLLELRNVIRDIISEARGKGDPADYMGAWVVIARGEDGKVLYKTGDKDTGSERKTRGGGTIEVEGEGPGYWHPDQKRAKVYTTEKGAQSGMMAEKMAGVKTAAIKRIF